MELTLKSIEWKALLVGILATLFMVILLVAAASLVADIVLLKAYNRDYSFSLFSKDYSGFFVFSLNPNQSDAGYASAYEDFYKRWFPIISGIASTFGFLIGGYVTGRLAKTRKVLHGIIIGAVIAIISLSWVTPISIASAYGGAVLASRQ
jgi:hypothetical protein